MQPSSMDRYSEFDAECEQGRAGSSKKGGDREKGAALC